MRIYVLIVIASALVIIAQAAEDADINYGFPCFKYKSYLDDIVRPYKHVDHTYDISGVYLTESRVVGHFNWSFCCRAVYRNRVINPLWNKNSPQFGSVQSNGRAAPVAKCKNNIYPAEGLAFLAAPMASEPVHLKDSNGSETWLGLFNVTGATKGKNSSLTLAIEFDTVLNDFPVYHWRDADDPYYRAMDYNLTVYPRGHQASAIDNCNLRVYPRACRVVMDDNENHRATDVFVGLSAASYVGNHPAIGPSKASSYIQWYVWIDYNRIEKSLSVFLANVSSKPVEPILHGEDINFSKYFAEKVLFRLSVSTRLLHKLHIAVSWKFSAKTPWKHVSVHISLTVILIISVLLCLLVISALVAVVFCVLRRIINVISRSMQTVDIQTVSHGDIELVVNCNHPREYHYDELSAATNNFREDQKLGEGGFGSAYKGILQDTSEIVAVKQISAGSRQGSKEYLSEITILGQLRHRSLVPLLGWCHEKASELLLVYKFMSKGSLEKYLFGSPTVEWNTRYKIAEDIASALVYLHDEVEERVVHRDIKSSNIMLNEDMQAKLGDFGLARIIEQGHSSHFTTPAGTPGYLAPECVVTWNATAESDVFSFGVVALEIACGRPAVNRTLENSLLLEWVWDLYEKNSLLDAADKKLNGEFDEKEMKQLMMVGLWCCNLDFTQRPKIRQVFQTLKFEAPLPCLPPTEDVAHT